MSQLARLPVIVRRHAWVDMRRLLATLDSITERSFCASRDAPNVRAGNGRSARILDEDLLNSCSTSCYDVGMSQVVTQRELRNGSGEIMRRLDQGESFVVTRNGVPVGELTPLRRLRFVTAESIAQIFQAAPPIDSEQFRRDLDAVADQGIEPRG